MNRMQKIAWCQLALVGVAAVFSVIAMAFFMRKYGYSPAEAWWLAAGYAAPILILAVIAPPFVFRKKKDKVDPDERDLMIDRCAMRMAFGAAFLFFIAVCMITWIAVGVDTMIPAVWLTRIVYAAWTTTIVTHPLTTLVCYNREGLANE